MGFLSKKARELEANSSNKDQKNLMQMSSDTAVDVIKKLGGTDQILKSSIVDNYIVFTNASGGTGASTIVSNVAYMAAMQGMKTLVIDLNILYPIQHIYLGIKQDVKEKNDLVSYLLGKSSLADSIESKAKYSLMYANNRDLAHLINCNDDAVIDNFNSMMNKLKNLFDIILIDCPMSIDNMLYNNALYSCDTIYLVWDEGIGSIANADKIRRALAYCGIDSYTKMMAILNKRTNINYSMYPFKKLNMELVEVIPFDTAIIESSVRAEIFCESGSSNSKNAVEFERAIQRLTDTILRTGGLIDNE